MLLWVVLLLFLHSSITKLAFQHQFAQRERPILNEDTLINMTAVFEAEKQMPPEVKRNSGRKNDFGKSNNFIFSTFLTN
jgi:hypothetical protein